MMAQKPCPTCGDLHPNGIGVSLCACRDCWLLFSDIPLRSLSPQSLARLKELLEAIAAIDEVTG